MFGDAEQLHRLGVDVQDAEVVREQNDAVGRVLDDFVAHGFRPRAHIGEAHLDVGIAVQDGDCLVAAGGVAARAAVELVRGRVLARLGEHRADVLFAGDEVLRDDARMRLGEVHGHGDERRARRLLRGVLAHILVALYGAALARYAAWAADAGVFAAVHFEEQPVQGIDFLQHLGTAFDAVHRHIFVSGGERFKRLDYAAGDGVIPRAVGGFFALGFDLGFAQIDVFVRKKLR